MSRFPSGKEPFCPQCSTNRIFRRGSKTCQQCYKTPGWWRTESAVSDAQAPDPDPIATTDSRTFTDSACEITKTTTQRVRTLQDLIRICEIDTDEWEVERYVCNKWDMGSVPRAVGSGESWSRPSTEPVVTELYQVKVWLKRKVAIVAARAEIAALLADAKRQMPLRPQSPRGKITPTHNMLEISIPDLHVGKLAWAKETGWENYDTRTAERIHDDALDALLNRTDSHRFEHVLFIVGNDLLHSDTKAGTTTAGTVLDTDSRFQKSFSIVRRMIVRAIDRAREIAPVHVLMVPGNHDTLAVWHLGDSLECYYHRDDLVSIDNAPTMRKYHQFGKVMLMFTHGNKGKLQDYPLLMAAEQPKMFGETLHREAHTGDKHHLKVQEYRGIKVRISPALCPPDAWHAEHQFVGSARSAEAFVWQREEGLIGTAYYTVPAPPKDRDEGAA